MPRSSTPRVLLLLVLGWWSGGCSGGTRPADVTAATAADERQYLLERVEDAGVLQLYADGFAALPLREKTLVWHLYQAALAGRDIFYDQKHRDALAMRRVLEAIVSRPDVIDPQALEAIRTYTKLFWISNGPYRVTTARKFVLTSTPEAFARAAHAARAAGAAFPTGAGESLDALLARLEPMFFDPDVDPIVTNKSPGPGLDILTGSANNLYSGVSMADLQGFVERYPLNSRLVRTDAGLVEEVYRLDGRYGTELAAVVSHLERAIPFAPPPTAEALRALIRWYQTGDDADRAGYDIAWVRDSAATVDTINGFIEVYLDPRGVKGAWEGIVYYVDQEKTDRIRRLAASAQEFEDLMPFDPAYRKPAVTGIVAHAVEAVMQTGDAGPVTFIGVNLPNDQRIREEYGSKSLSLTNVQEAYDRASSDALRQEFSWSAAEAARARQYSSLANELLTDMHEVIGHASGQQAPGAPRNPQEAIREHFSALEEARADLVGLYFIGDPRLAELGVISAAEQDAIVRAAYESMARNALVQLRAVREGTQLEDDHMRNQQLIVRWLMANTRAVEERRRDGRTYYVVTDVEAFRTGAGRLLSEVQRIKSEGDYDAAARLLETYGIRFDPSVRDEVVGRVDALDLPSYYAFVMPELTAVTAPDGTITDVRISYPRDLTAQMLGFSASR